MKLFLPLGLGVVALSGCAAARPIVSTPPAACAKLVPSGWHDPVPGTPVPDTTALAGATALDAAIYAAKQWAGAYVGMSGQLEKANGRTADAIDIVTNCEAMVNSARPK